MKLENSNLKNIYRVAMQLYAEKGSTEISISELAERAGVARGTIYNNITSFGTLFEDIAARLVHDMSLAVVSELEGVTDPAERLARGITLYLKRSHDEPDWANFLLRFGISNGTLQSLWQGPFAEDLGHAIDSGQFKCDRQQMASLITFVGCTVLGGMGLVREGTDTWKGASRTTIELVLRALGLSDPRARKLAASALGSEKKKTP